VFANGLEKVRIEKRLGELEAVADAPRVKASPGKSSRASPEFAGLIGRAFADDRDAGVLVAYQAGFLMKTPEIGSLREALGTWPNGKTRVELAGILTLSDNGNVSIHHVGGSASGGVLTLFVDGQKVSEVGDDRSKNSTFLLPLTKGHHALRWVLSGGDLGIAQVEFLPDPAAGAAAPTLEVHATKDLIAAARQGGVKKEYKFGDEAFIAAVVPTVRVEVERPLAKTGADKGTTKTASVTKATSSKVVRKKYFPGLVGREFAKQKSQLDGNLYTGWVPPDELVDPIGPVGVVGSLLPIKLTSERNGVVSGYLRIDVAGDYLFNAAAGYDRVALYIDSNLVCPFRDGENASATVKLEKGMVPIQVACMPLRDGIFRVKWQPPGTVELSAIPPTVMFHTE